MSRDEAIRSLKDLYTRRDHIAPEDGPSWVEAVSTVLHRWLPERAAEFEHLASYLSVGLSVPMVEHIWQKMGALTRAAIGDLERARQESEPTGSVEMSADSRAVFVVHGRNDALRRSIFDFLRALGLRPIEWSQAVRHTGAASPYIGQILDAAFGKAQAVVVLLSPDDEVRLSESLWTGHEAETEMTVQHQARPNVLFEAGMAFGTHAGRTVLVQCGTIKQFSDIAGRHVVRLDNSSERRTDLAERLRHCGCDVDMSGRDWLSVGDFSVDTRDPRPWPKASITATGPVPAPRLAVEMGYFGVWKHEQIVVSNIGQATAFNIEVLVDGKAIKEFQGAVRGQPIPAKLREGEQFGIKLALSKGSPERIELTVTWEDEKGAHFKTERALQLI